jgi:hypothetical protein
MTPLVTDQMDSAGALVSLETNVQPERLLPSNNSTRCVGAMGGSFVCASREGAVVANKNASANRKVKNDFIRQSLSAPGKNDKPEWQFPLKTVARPVFLRQIRRHG